MFKGGVVALIFFVFGVVTAPYLPVTAESRLALPDNDAASIQRISFDAIKVYPDGVKIEHPNLRYAQVRSNSMAPIITDQSTVLEQVPSSEEDIRVGDAISFYEPSADAIVLHLVTEIIEKDGKKFYRTKGTANPEEDDWLVPFENVKGVLVGVIK